MDEWSALNAFWNGFSIPAYDENTVPDDEEMPYITFEASVGGFDDPILLSASLYYRSQSWREISQKAKEIGQTINSGHGVGYQGGRLWITPQSPFAQRMSEPNDSGVRRILLQIQAEFQTAF